MSSESQVQFQKGAALFFLLVTARGMKLHSLTHKKMKIIFVDIIIFVPKLYFPLLYSGYINIIYGYTDIIQVIQAKWTEKSKIIPITLLYLNYN